MIRVLVVGDAVTPTGFARVLHSILERLHLNFEIHHLGVNYHGDPHPYPWKIYPAGSLGDGYGMNRLAPLIEELCPRLIFMMGDLWILMRYAGILARLETRVPAIAYFPVESDPVEPDAMTHMLKSVDVLATYTNFGADAVRIAIEQARSVNPGLPMREVVIIPHGVDSESFYPIEQVDGAPGKNSRRAARERVFPGRPDLLDAFIVLNANRNQPRKRIDITIEAFALFARNKPEHVKLYLHMARQDEGWDIFRLSRRFGIENRLLLTRADNSVPNESVAGLNLIYNVCDVGVNTACAEGWGLVSFEHAATGAAQIVPRHTSMTELWEGAAELIEPRFTLITENTLINAYYTSAADVAAALQGLYEDPEKRRRMARAAREMVLKTEYQWDNIANRWSELFNSRIEPLSKSLSKE